MSVEIPTNPTDQLPDDTRVIAVEQSLAGMYTAGYVDPNALPILPEQPYADGSAQPIAIIRSGQEMDKRYTVARLKDHKGKDDGLGLMGIDHRSNAPILISKITSNPFMVTRRPNFDYNFDEHLLDRIMGKKELPFNPEARFVPDELFTVQVRTGSKFDVDSRQYVPTGSPTVQVVNHCLTGSDFVKASLVQPVSRPQVERPHTNPAGTPGNVSPEHPIDTMPRRSRSRIGRLAGKLTLSNKK